MVIKRFIRIRLQLAFMLFVLLLVACDVESITVPASDSTLPVASMSVQFTTADGNRETLTLTSGDTPASRELSPDKPVTVLASGRDADGGVKNISISGPVTIFCAGEETGLSVHLFEQNPDDASVGETAATVRLQDLTIDPSDFCPGGVENLSGGVVATAENFHGGADTTAVFSFEINP